ncbi:hypothetical protein Z046_31235 [Pseudomonas aeruginosa VRFPA09]|nr:hypothetical protein Z046_31235 [Pseudomonas aeruginosa VRFPA09]
MATSSTHRGKHREQQQRAVGNLLALGNQRVGADDAVLADLRPIEDHRVDPYQAVVAHAATMQHGVVADGDALAEGQRIAHVGVHHRAVLDVAVLADMDQLVVAAQHRAKPDAGAGIQANLADHRCAGRDPAVGMGFDAGIAQAVFHRDLLMAGVCAPSVNSV